MSLTDDQKSELFLWNHHGKSMEQLISMVGEWITDAFEASYDNGYEEGRPEGYDDGYSEGLTDGRSGHTPDRFSPPRFEYREQGIWHCVYDAERQEYLPGIYMPDQAKTLADDLNRRFRDG
jgi:hypothetical protein